MPIVMYNHVTNYNIHNHREDTNKSVSFTKPNAEIFILLILFCFSAEQSGSKG